MQRRKDESLIYRESEREATRVLHGCLEVGRLGFDFIKKEKKFV